MPIGPMVIWVHGQALHREQTVMAPADDMIALILLLLRRI